MDVTQPSFDPAWEQTHRERQWGFLYDPRLILFVWKRFSTAKRRQDVLILDLGCGVGAQAIEMARLGYSVIGVDASPSAIARARDLAPKRMLGNIEFIVGDVAAMSPKPGTFDLVADACCLECLPLDHAHTALRAAAIGLKPDGALFSIAKADGWVQSVAQVGHGSRASKRAEVDALYGVHFQSIKTVRDSHMDCFGQEVMEWTIECTHPLPFPIR